MVLFHDTRVKDRGFGVWKLWEELTKRYPSFEFHHGFGLGVLGYGPAIPDIMREFFASNDRQSSAIREAYSHLGQSIEARFRLLSSNVARSWRPPQMKNRPLVRNGHYTYIWLRLRRTSWTYEPISHFGNWPNSLEITTSTSEKRIQLPPLLPADPKIAIIQRLSIKEHRPVDQRRPNDDRSRMVVVYRNRRSSRSDGSRSNHGNRARGLGFEPGLCVRRLF